jgi:hypothetical protein
MRNLKASVVIGAISVALSLLLLATGLPAVLDPLLLKVLAIPQDGRVIAGTPWLMLLISAFGIAWVRVDISNPLQKNGLSIAAVGLLLTWAPVLALQGKFFSPVLPVFGVLCSVGIASAWGKTRSGRRNQQLEELFRLRLPKSSFQSILSSDATPDFPGCVVNASVLVIAVQNHAELMELLPRRATPR